MARAKLYTVRDAARSVSANTPSDAEERYRTPWRRDFARLVHSAAFRRLQGKTQLFPGHENDFFRNRLTHSLEVAQIAKSIAIRINHVDPYFKKNPVDTDLVETAALAHDLGHPPFGHNGEKALDECMVDVGGFEGNAQTLRILSRIEKRETFAGADDNVAVDGAGKDLRVGLNLTYRTLAATLKYDRKIPESAKYREKPGNVYKGYYGCDADIVARIKENITHDAKEPFRTIECSIMDVADDIAYSTYDLEDAFKAKFLTPVSMLAQENALLSRVAETITKRLNVYYSDLPPSDRKIESGEVYATIVELFEVLWSEQSDILDSWERGDFGSKDEAKSAVVALLADRVAAAERRLIQSGYHRTKDTSKLVGLFIRNTEVIVNERFPSQSRVRLNVATFKKVEVIKNFVYEAIILSPMLKVAEYRGKDIVKSIFSAIEEDDGYLLMPDDYRDLHVRISGIANKKRVICDFVAGMTDRYAIQFYNRLFGTIRESIYTPL